MNHFASTASTATKLLTTLTYDKLEDISFRALRGIILRLAFFIRMMEKKMFFFFSATSTKTVYAYIKTFINT
jgi:hypothetical protein